MAQSKKEFKTTSLSMLFANMSILNILIVGSTARLLGAENLIPISSATVQSDNSRGAASKSNEQTQNIEKWLLIGFCSVCILAMVICIIVLIVYKVRKNQRQRDDEEERDLLIRPPSAASTSRKRQPRQGSTNTNSKQSRQGDTGANNYPHYMIPPMSVVSEKSEYAEYSAMGGSTRGNMSTYMLRQYRGSENQVLQQTLLSADQTHEAVVASNIDLLDNRKRNQTMSEHDFDLPLDMERRKNSDRPLTTALKLSNQAKSESSSLFDPSMQAREMNSSAMGSTFDNNVQMTIEQQNTGNHSQTSMLVSPPQFSPFDEPKGEPKSKNK